MDLIAKFELVLKVEIKSKFYIFHLNDIFENHKELKIIERSAYRSENFNEVEKLPTELLVIA